MLTVGKTRHRSGIHRPAPKPPARGPWVIGDIGGFVAATLAGMNSDVSRNVVVFQLRRTPGELAIGEGPTQAEDCVRQAWAVASQQHQAAPSEVRALHSEWETSAAYAGFIQRAFPEAKLTYNFNRPAPDGWGEAFAAARQRAGRALTRC